MKNIMKSRKTTDSTRRKGRDAQADPDEDYLDQDYDDYDNEEEERIRRIKNKVLVRVSYLMVALFLSMAGYLNYFNVVLRDDNNNNQYNTNQSAYQEQLIGANIDSADGNALAQTDIAEDGTESRSYPYSNLFAHIVGYATNGKSGIESVHNYDLLSSHASILDQIREEKLDTKVQGDSLVLTLNTQLQQVCYDALGDNKGAIVVLEPSTGKVLAMVSKPDFDPNTIEQDWDALINDDSNSSLFNRALQGQYPPGSTFKIITMSAGLSEGVVSPNDSFFCPGYKIVEDRRIHCHKRTGHGAENFVQGAQNSCNPVFIEVGLRLGVEKFCDYFRNFGLMEKTGIDLPGEASTIMHKEENIGEVELATMAFGQSFQITPIRLAATVSALVNGGKMVTPHVATDVLDEEGNVVKHLNFPEKEGVLSEETSRTVREILESVVSEGSGKNAYLEGYSIGGKTATSQTLPRSANRYISSFLGFTPAEHPTVLGLCIIRNPQGVYYGGTICAPVIRDIFSNVLPYLGIGHNS